MPRSIPFLFALLPFCMTTAQDSPLGIPDIDDLAERVDVSVLAQPTPLPPPPLEWGTQKPQLDQLLQRLPSAAPPPLAAEAFTLTLPPHSLLLRADVTDPAASLAEMIELALEEGLQPTAPLELVLHRDGKCSVAIPIRASSTNALPLGLEIATPPRSFFGTSAPLADAEGPLTYTAERLRLGLHGETWVAAAGRDLTLLYFPGHTRFFAGFPSMEPSAP